MSPSLNLNIPVWTRIANNLDPTTRSFTWDTTSLNTDYQWYSFNATLGYNDLWVTNVSQYWLNVV